jgi:molecular chaperone DnaK (HSP70)
MIEKTAVIGFDLGHGETALAIIDDAYSLRGKGGIQPRQVFTTKSQPTVIATLQDGRKVWGANAVFHTQAAPGQVSEFEICFKAKPGRDTKTDTLIQEFATCVYGDARAELNGQLDNRARWFIGCPSAWDEATRTAYGRLFKTAGFDIVVVVKESRAAFTYYFEKNGGLSIDDLRRPTVVLDFGSSTLDATLAIGLRDEELDNGCPLGATWIDKAILHWNLKHCSRVDFPAGRQEGEKIAEILAKNRCERGRVELKVREAKEYYFNKQDLYQDENSSYEPGSIRVGDYRFRIVLHGKMMQELLNTPLGDVVPDLLDDDVPAEVKNQLADYSWLGRCQQFLENIGNKLKDQGVDRPAVRHVLLTGGASRMQPVRQLVRHFFGAGQMLDGERDGDGKVECDYDTEPELCIARGLACWGRTAIQGEAFRDQVNKLLFGTFSVTDKVLAELQAAGVPEPVVAKVAGLKTLPDIKRHPNAFYAALADTLGAEDYNKHIDVITEKAPLDDRRLLNLIVDQLDRIKFEEVVADKMAAVALPWLRSWHDGNTKSNRLGPNIASELRQWRNSSEMRTLVKTRVERFESAIRKEVNDIVRPVMAKYQIGDFTFMEQTFLYDKFTTYYNSDVESLAKWFDTNASFKDMGDSWWTRWIEVGDRDLLRFVWENHRVYIVETCKELYAHKSNMELLVMSIFNPVSASIERAITATQYLISADFVPRGM